MKLDNFIMQSDPLIIVDCINDSGFSTALDPIANDYNIHLGEFKSIILMYVSRLYNMDVHHMLE